MKYSFILVLLFLKGSLVFGQKIENIKAVTSEEQGKIIITYDLVDTRSYTLSLYSSHNNFTSPLKKVAGDVGASITPGIGKKIVWDAASELIYFNGEVNFKIKGEAVVQPFAFKTPAMNAVLKRGKVTVVEWEGGRLNQSVKLELYQGSNLISVVAETGNGGHYQWEIPRKQQKGLYNLKLISGKESILSPAFKIKSKTPVMLKILPIAIAGGAVAYFLTRPGDEDLPAAPDPPN